MNLLLLSPEEVDPSGIVELRGRRARHILEVLRAEAGDRLRAGIVRGPCGEAELLEVGESVRLRLHVTQPAGAPPPIELVLAVPRPKVLARVLQTAAALGVKRIDLVNAWRVDKSYFGSPRLEGEALRRDLLLGCEQGGLTWVPEIDVHRLLMPFLERLGARAADARVLAHPRAGRGIEELELRWPGWSTAVVAIGPEGGWIDDELSAFAKFGFACVALGTPVLRVDAAVPATLAQIALLAATSHCRRPTQLADTAFTRSSSRLLLSRAGSTRNSPGNSTCSRCHHIGTLWLAGKRRKRAGPQCTGGGMRLVTKYMRSCVEEADLLSALCCGPSRAVPILLLTLFAACSQTVQFTPTNALPRALPRRSAEQVHVFATNAPEAAYVEIGLLQTRQCDPDDFPQVIQELRQRAADQGCDGVILDRRPGEGRRNRESYLAACIVYDGDESRARK
jgi:RsmE family RNA methyltransferase